MAHSEAPGLALSPRFKQVPLVNEARGLDAGPRLVDRLTGLGDLFSAGLVRQIASEEVAHVAVGVHHFRRQCALEGTEDLEARFLRAVDRHVVGEGATRAHVLRGPFNHAARAVAGMERGWYDVVPSQ